MLSFFYTLTIPIVALTVLINHFNVDNFCHFGGILTSAVLLKDDADKSAASFIYNSFYRFLQLGSRFGRHLV